MSWWRVGAAVAKHRSSLLTFGVGCAFLGGAVVWLLGDLLVRMPWTFLAIGALWLLAAVGMEWTIAASDRLKDEMEEQREVLRSLSDTPDNE